MAQETHLLKLATDLLREIAGHQFSIDGTHRLTRPRYHQETTERMVNYLRYLFTGSLDALQQGLDLDERETLFVRTVFVRMCKHYRATTLSAQKADWYDGIVSSQLTMHGGNWYFCNFDFRGALTEEEATKAAAIRRQKIKDSLDCKHRAKQAELAKTYLPGDLPEMSRKAALAVIDGFLTAEPDVEKGKSRTTVAAEAAKADLAALYADHPDLIKKGIMEGRASLHKAFNKLKGASAPCPGKAIVEEVVTPTQPESVKDLKIAV